MQEITLGITPSLAALDDAPSLRQREWNQGEPGEDIPRQYTSISGCLTPTTPRCEDMRLDLTLNVTPDRSLVDLPAAVDNMTEDRERRNQVPVEGLQGTSTETAYMGIPDTFVKTKAESTTREAHRVIQRTKEASREEAIASTQQFFATVDQRNTNIHVGSPTGISAEVHERDVLNTPTSTAATTLVIFDVEPRGTSSPRISLPEGPHPNLLLQLHVDLGLGCSKSLKGRSMNL